MGDFVQFLEQSDKMAFGKLFTKGSDNPRTTAIMAVAKANNLDLEVITADPQKPTVEHLKANPLGKIPAFLGEDGFALSEAIAVAIYITSQNEKTTLLGKTKQDYASILKWMSFFNTEVLPPLGGRFRPLLGLDSYNKKNVEESSKKALRAIGAIETHLVRHTYLVGDRITLADLFAASIITRGFQYFFDKQWRQENPTTTRWYETVINQPIYSAVADKLEFLEKPKLPCDLLPKSSFPLDEWKRYFSNNKESESLPWFWDNVPFADYSIWRVDYKYNDELTLVFM